MREAVQSVMHSGVSALKRHRHEYVFENRSKVRWCMICGTVWFKTEAGNYRLAQSTSPMGDKIKSERQARGANGI